MNRIAKILGPLALAATISAPLLFLFKVMGEPAMKGTLLAAAAAYFIAAPFWLKGAEE